MKRVKDATRVAHDRRATLRARHADEVKVARGDVSGEPRLPHERDESADSQQASPPQPTDLGRKAFDDVQAGRVDTDRGPVLEQLFERHGPQGGPRRAPSDPADAARRKR
jgi:hypothetical protein